MFKKLLNCSFCLLLTSMAFATELHLTSPDGKLQVTVSDRDGMPSYTVSYNHLLFLKESPLGIVTNTGDYSVQMNLSEQSQISSIDESYELPNIKKSHPTYRANRQICSFSKEGKVIYDVIFQVSNHDIAFKYKLYPQGNTKCCTIRKENTGFCLPEGCTTFLCPQSKPMGGFARTSPSYETSYTADDVTGKNGWGEGYTFPCLFRLGDNGWILISETGTDGGYCGCRLLGQENGLYTIGFPQEGEMNGNGSVCPGISLPGETPWRTITLGESLKPIVETTITFDVVSPKYEASRKYDYGKGSWSWIIGMDGSTKYDEQIRYIDFSAAMGYQSVLVDALWDTQIGYDNIEALAAYGATKGVGLYLWYNSNGYWNDAPQTPKGIMDNAIKRRKEMAWMQKTGIKGIKVDFFGGDKQATIQLYEDILADANDYGLLVIFHGCTLPRGWERMYPNYAASEAVLASENLHFSQGSCDAEAFNACLHPFIRNTVGSMDFGGSTLNKYYHASNERGNRRMTSEVFALATAVLFQSPVQHFALAPNNLTDASPWAIDFMKKVPTTWDETLFIDGYPGKYTVLARRHGDKWYIAGINAQKESLKLTVSLPMLPAGTSIDLYSDDSELNGNKTSAKIGKKQVLSVTIPCNGAFVAVSGDIPFTYQGNPIVRNKFTADPAPLVYNGRLYLYTGHDEYYEGQDKASGGKEFNITEWLCYSTRDMKTWTDHGSVLKPTDFKWAVGEAWAAQVIEREGKFYYYTTVQAGEPFTGKAIGVAVSDSPTGPFVDAIGKPLVTDKMTANGARGWWNDIDPTVIIEENGQAWLCWGNGTCFMAKLKANMTELDSEIKVVDVPNYVEGPWLHERKGIYYLSYAGMGKKGENICYATATDMEGPWTAQGELTGSAKNSFTIHPGIISFNKKWYLFYHNATLEIDGHKGATGRRAVCVDEIHYAADGKMNYVIQKSK